MARPLANPAESAAVPWILRIGVAGCFIGHGAWGIITKAGWLPYFAVGGVSAPTAWELMPWIGRMDVTVGLLALFWPCRALFVWGVVWGTWTALCRPLAGESCWEFVERAGNYGVPLALLVAAGWPGALFRRINRWPIFASPDAAPAKPPGSSRPWLPAAAPAASLALVLRAVTFLVLAGHAGCTLMEASASFRHNYVALWPHAPALGIAVFGWFELGLALAALFRPGTVLLLVVVAFKFATESLFLFAHAPIWEVMERFGSYTAPLALAVLLAVSPALSAEPAAPIERPA
ncbi:MAG TPA: hypothetical protein VHE61_11125 [Opitutaceae bacterium]|nr:hypothetical protein [Opitutaceae bacterium]